MRIQAIVLTLTKQPNPIEQTINIMDHCKTTGLSGHPKATKAYRIAIVAACLMYSSNLYAIPSPDLVINLSASIAQLLGLISVVFGGAFFSRKNSRSAKRGKKSGVNRVFLITAVVLLFGAVAMNILQYTSSVDAKNQRLQTNLVRKSVENGQSVGDTNLRTLSFSEQKTHSLGITTNTLQEWLDSNIDLNIIDVREDEEIEGGRIEGATHVRYPDLLQNPDLLPEGKNNLLLCYSGNRSSELCERLSQSGRSCNFMVGGYEKWMTESRQLSETATTDLSALRALPDFKNKDVLLDTPDVHKLVNNEQAEFVDVRYPGDFALNHIPGAHNITMRALNSTALIEKLNELPDKPLIAACYDKRSCFYSQLIGVRIDRLGKDFRGRYTVPHEYHSKGNDRAHVAQWKQDNEQGSLLSYVTNPLSGLLQWLTDKTGHFVLGILALVLLSRLALLPLTLKSERDQVVLKRLKPEIESTKEKFAEHPRALSKATLGLYKQHDIKPVFNLLASVAQMSFLLLFYSVINNAAKGWTSPFAWNLLPSDADPYYVLPAIVTGLFMLLISMQLKLNTKFKQGLFIVGGLAFFALMQGLSSAVNVYFIFSLSVLILQNLLIKVLARKLNWDGSKVEEPRFIVDDGIVPLRDAHLLSSTGKKAARLGELITAGYNVPEGFVFTGEITHRHKEAKATDSYLSQEEVKRLSLMWLKLKADKVAVRSSGVSEDGGDTSFAGVYDSILNVNKNNLVDAVKKVYQSLDSDFAQDYNTGVNQSNPDNPAETLTERGGVVVQKMVPAEYAGVLFTEHPANAGAMLVELVSGLGEELVSGSVTPDSYSFGKATGVNLSDANAAIDLQPLLEMGRELEEMFDHPQDIEWAYSDGKFFLLQARNITRSICDQPSAIGIAESERRKLIAVASHATDPSKPVFVQNELSELLPTPTPLSASLMRKLWHAGGSTDLACQQLGIPYDVTFDSPDFVTTAFGKTYINKLEERERLGKGPGALAAFQLAKNADDIADNFENDFLPAFLASNALNRALDYQRLSTDALIHTLKERLNTFLVETYVEAEIINISADYYWKTATAKLESDGIEPGKFLNYVPPTVVSNAYGLLSKAGAGTKEIQSFIETFGHRAPHDYELSTPRYSEDPSLVMNLMKGGAKNHSTPFLAPLPEKKLLRVSVERVHRFQALKEEAKHYCMLELNEIRRMIMTLDKRLDLKGQIFQLGFEEIFQLSDQAQLEALTETIAQRLKEAATWKNISPPALVSLQDLETMDVSTGRINRATNDSDLSGKRVAGDSPVTGVARVIQSVDQIEEFIEGEILVARMTDPQWYPLFPMAKGIVTEIGGWLSHAAIVAREYNLPAIVGVPNACDSIQTGDVIALHTDGSIELHHERRRPESPLRDVAPRSSDPVPANAVSGSVLDLQAILGRTESANEAFRTLHDKRSRQNKRSMKRSLKGISATGTDQQHLGGK